jgi:hypothetical protein
MISIKTGPIKSKQQILSVSCSSNIKTKPLFTDTIKKVQPKQIELLQIIC